MTSSEAIIDFIRDLFPNRDFIPLHEPYFVGNEKKYLIDCVDSTFVSSVGKYVDRFEAMVREYTGAKYAVATVNGTAALHIALKLAGVMPGDLVLTQPITFIATCNAISYCNAEPVFIDIDPVRLGMSPTALDVWIRENTEVKQTAEGEKVCLHRVSGRKISACVPMHTFGHPCEIDRVVTICAEYGIKIVEDAAESIGSYYKGQHTGTFADLGILSFNGNKTITTGGGGMILTNDEKTGKLAKHITTTAKIPHPWKFEHDMVGYNYRLPNINAALGCAQMEQLPAILANKRDTAMHYKEYFSIQDHITFVDEPEFSISNFWLNVILLSDEKERDRFLEQTNGNGVMTRPAWIMMNKLRMFSHCLAGELPIAEDIEGRLVNIPSSYRKG